MRLAEPAAVFKYGRLKPPYDEVKPDSVIRLFFPFLCFHIGVHMTLIWTFPEQHPCTKKLS